MNFSASHHRTTALQSVPHARVCAGVLCVSAKDLRGDNAGGLARSRGESDPRKAK